MLFSFIELFFSELSRVYIIDEFQTESFVPKQSLEQLNKLGPCWWSEVSSEDLSESSLTAAICTFLFSFNTSSLKDTLRSMLTSFFLNVTSIASPSLSSSSSTVATDPESIMFISSISSKLTFTNPLLMMLTQLLSSFGRSLTIPLLNEETSFLVDLGLLIE